MVLPLSLSATQKRRLAETLTSTHHVRIKVELLDFNHNRLKDLSSMLMDGQVNIASEAEVTRTCSVKLWDPNRLSTLDSTNLASGVNYYTRMLRVTYIVWRYGDKAGTEVAMPIFTGPIMSLSRSGGYLEIDAGGKEHLSIKQAFWTARKYNKGLLKWAVIRAILRDAGGEAYYSLAKPNVKTGSVLSYARESLVWPEAKKLARSMGYRLFYDGRGVARLKQDGKTTSYTFRDGLRQALLSDVDIDYDDSEIRNVVVVNGGTPPGKKTKQATAMATLPSNHPLNHNRMGRRGVPNVRLETISRSDLKKVSQCVDLAKRTLDKFADQQLSVKFDALPIPFLEEGDWVSVQVQGEFSVGFRLQEMSIPLSGLTSSVGSLRNLSVRRGARGSTRDLVRAKGRLKNKPKKKSKKSKKKSKSKKGKK